MVGLFVRIARKGLCAIAIVCMTGCASIDSSKYSQEATPVVEAFLQLMDDRSFHAASGMIELQFSAFADQQRVSMVLDDLRRPLGKTLKRKSWGAYYNSTFPGMPDGDYLSMYFETKFQNKEYAREMILLVKKYNTWVVANYVIQ